MPTAVTPAITITPSCATASSLRARWPGTAPSMTCWGTRPPPPPVSARARQWTRSSRTTTTRPAPARWARWSTSASASTESTGSTSPTARSSRPCRARTPACRPYSSRTGSPTGSSRAASHAEPREEALAGGAAAIGLLQVRRVARILEQLPRRAGDPRVDLLDDPRRRLVVEARDQVRRRLDLPEAIRDVPVAQRARDVELARPDHGAVDGRILLHERER